MGKHPVQLMRAAPGGLVRQVLLLEAPVVLCYSRERSVLKLGRADRLPTATPAAPDPLRQMPIGV
jgi:hypothetical protein